MNSKKIISVLFSVIITCSAITNAKAASECFEGVSRSIFKFNMAFDDAILEPIAKGYNKLPDQSKMGLVTSLLTYLPYFQFQTPYYKETFVKLVMLLVVY